MTYDSSMRDEINAHSNLSDAARDAMLEEDFLPDPPPEVIAEINALDETLLISAGKSKILDLRHLLWSSIDNEDSRDLDQLEVAERLDSGNIRLLVGIADVDAFISKNSAVDFYAAQNTTSVYTGVETFPMLPRRVSENLTSLLEDEDRLAVVIDFTVAKDGTVKLNGVYRALVHNHAKLDYDSVGGWLDGNGALPEKASNIAGLEEQLRLQDEAANRLRAVRQSAGALEFETVEAVTTKQEGGVYELVVKQKSAARYLIENLMITTNVLMAGFVRENNYPAIVRIVRRPERWQRIAELAKSFGESLPAEPDSKALSDFLERRRAADPVHFPDLSLSVVKLIGSGDYTVVPPGTEGEGHFGLAVSDYTHSTAPNRRYADLVTQRLVKAAIVKAASPYTIKELEQIAARCNERQSAARKVERRMRKIVAAQIFAERIGEIFEGIVTGVSSKGTFVRILQPPFEGRIVKGETGLDVGDKTSVRLIKTDAEKGFIDFERIEK